MAGAVKGDALPGLNLRGDDRMLNHARKNRRGGGWRERRYDHHGWREDVIRTLRADGAGLGAMRRHHAVMLAVSAAAYGHAGLVRGRPKERQREGQHEQHQQRNGERSTHTIIIANGAWLGGVVPLDDSNGLTPRIAGLREAGLD